MPRFLRGILFFTSIQNFIWQFQYTSGLGNRLQAIHSYIYFSAYHFNKFPYLFNILIINIICLDYYRLQQVT